MSTDLVIRQAELVRLDTDQIKFLAHTDFVSEKIRGNLPMIFATIATGREIGIGDMAALRHIHIIDGKAGFSAEIMVSQVRRHGHSIVGETGATQATVTGTRGDNGDTMTVTWTMEMADQAGLLSKQNWRKFPLSMLWARAASQLCRMLFADCFAGNTYTPEELGDEDAALDPTAEPIAGANGLDAGAATSSGGEPSTDASVPQPVTPTADQAASPPADVPFGDDYDAPILPAGVDADKPPTKKQIDALNGLVKQLENAGHITTLQLWQSMGIEPTSADYEIKDGVERLRWSPLRDQLTRAQAHQLLDRLIPFADEKLPKDAA